MASRLSDINIKATYETGIRGLPLSPVAVAELLKPVDLEAIVNGPMPASKIQSIPAQSVYQAIKLRGIEESLDVLPMLSREQFVRILDYDSWDKNGLSPQKAFRWLKAYATLGKQPLYARFVSLDEEYQVALTQGRLEAYDEEAVEKLPQDVQDQLRPMPCNSIFYLVKNCERDEEEMIVAIIEAALEQNLPFAYSLLEHAHWMPPGEAEAQLQQFRKARLEEDGFVDFDESLLTFVPLAVDDQVVTDLLAKGALAAAAGVLVSSDDKAGAPRLFLDEAFVTLSELGERSPDPETFAALEMSFMQLANSLSAAVQLDAADLDGLKYALLHAKALSSLGLEYLARQDRFAAAELLQKTHAKTLFRTGLGVVRCLQERVFDRLATLNLPDLDRARKLHQLGRHGQLLFDIDTKWAATLGLELAEALKGLFNRFPTLAEFYNESGDQSQAVRVRFAPFRHLQDLADFAKLLDQWFGEQEAAPTASSQSTDLH